MVYAQPDYVPHDAAEAMVLDNIRLVHHLCKRYIRRAEMANVDYEDLVQAGAIALWKAAQRYDASTGVKYGAYAATAIWREIQRGIVRSYGHVESTKINIYAERLDEPTEEGTALGDLITTAAKDDDTLACAAELLSTLSERDRGIVLARVYGYTMREIGSALGISGQRVHQILIKIGECLLRKEAQP